MRVGTSAATITPQLGTPLSGYADRDHGAETVLDDLEVRAFWIEDAGSAACIVTADVIGFDAAFTTSLRAELSERLGVSPDAVLLAASHTHSGPQTCPHLSKTGAPVPSYLDSFRSAIVDAVTRAKTDAKPASLAIGRSSLSGFAIHRRVVIDGRSVMLPNPGGVRDDEVTALVFRAPDSDAVRAVLFHYTCHPTVLGGYWISGDYPGAARRFVERALPGAHAGFLPGCFGDVRPNCVVMGGGAFRRGIPEDVAAYGKALGEEVVQAVARAAPAAGEIHLAGATQTVPLPIAGGVHTVGISLQRLDLTDEVALVAMGGEMCVDYGRFVKALRPGKTTLPLGYSNGLIGYVSPARYFAEGGYEPAESWPLFDLPGPFSPAVEEILRGELRDLVA